MSTPAAAAMAEIVAANAPLLKAAGFRKRRHSFNRRTDDGLVHVVNFWQHPKEAPAWTEVPGLRERRYGTFRIEFGVWVPEMVRDLPPQSNWVNEYNCHLRRTMGELMSGGPDEPDLWWDIDASDATERARAALVDHGLPWLAGLDDRDSVIERFERDGAVGSGMTPSADLDVAELLTAMDRNAEARLVLEQYVQRPLNRWHVEYLREYLPKVGHGDLADHLPSD